MNAIPDKKPEVIQYRDEGPIQVPINVPPRGMTELNDVEKMVIDSAICQLRINGLRYEGIATYINRKYNVKLLKASVYNRYKNYLKAIPEENLEEARALALMRANDIFQTAFQNYRQGGSPEHGKVATAANEQMIRMLGLDSIPETPQNHDEELESVRQRLLERAADIENAEIAESTDERGTESA